MPKATTQRQFGYFGRVCGGKAKPPKGMTKEQACEFIRGQSPKDLPKRPKRPKGHK